MSPFLASWIKPIIVGASTTMSAGGVFWGTYTIADNKSRHEINDQRFADEKQTNRREHDMILDGIGDVKEIGEKTDEKLDRILFHLMEKKK